MKIIGVKNSDEMAELFDHIRKHMGSGFELHVGGKVIPLAVDSVEIKNTRNHSSIKLGDFYAISMESLK